MAEDTKTVDGQGDTKSVPVVDDAAKVAADKVAADAAAAKAVSDKAAADAAAAANAGKTPEQIAADEKTVADKAAADKVAADAAAAKTGAPEKYDVKVPEGMKDLLDDADLKDLETKARAKGLTNEQLQGIVDARAEEIAAQSAAFRTQTESDPTIGGDKLQETQRLAKVAMDRLHPESTPEGKDFRTFLKKTGYGNHVQVVKHFANLGKMMAEDGHVAAGGAKAPRDAAETLYGKS